MSFVIAPGTMPSLDSARLKLARADHHLEWLAQDLRRITSENQAALPDHFRVEPGQRVEFVPPVAPGLAWGVVLGDCVQNLRAALDHTAWSLTPVSVRHANPKRPQFPIFDDIDVYRDRGQSRVADVDPAARAIIESLQPYNYSEPHIDPLHLLEVLSNIDKHRIIHSVANVTSRVQARTSRGSVQQVQDTTGAGLPTFAISAEGPEDVYSEWIVTFTVIFSNSDDATNRRVVSTLRDIRKRVAEAVDALEPYAI
jgi:hypothetical protein